LRVAPGTVVWEARVLRFLSPSPKLVVPPVAEQRPVKLHDESYDSWSEMFDKEGSRLDYLLAPGDYRGWGPLELVGRAGNTARRPATIRFHDPDADHAVHPVHRPTQARVDALNFKGAGTRNWLVQGLTFSEPPEAGTPTIRMWDGVRRITVDACLIERARLRGVWIKHARHCTIQRCVIRETLNGAAEIGRGDQQGIYVGNVDAEIRGIRILDNEIYDNGDGIQVKHYKHDPDRTVEVRIEGNDIYLTPALYLDGGATTWAENAIDLKAGSSRPRSTRIDNNRLWGFRRNAVPTARGELLVIQWSSRNVVVTRNIFSDAPRAMKDEVWKTAFEPDENRRRDIVFTGNQFHGIRDFDAEDLGFILKPITAGLSFTENHFARSDFLADKTPTNYRVAPTFMSNTLIDIGEIQRPRDPGGSRFPYKPGLNVSGAAPHGYELYQRQRWTGPTWQRGARPAARVEQLPTHEFPDPKLHRL
jgi:hypothetical protein